MIYGAEDSSGGTELILDIAWFVDILSIGIYRFIVFGVVNVNLPRTYTNDWA